MQAEFRGHQEKGWFLQNPSSFEITRSSQKAVYFLLPTETSTQVRFRHLTASAEQSYQKCTCKGEIWIRLSLASGRVGSLLHIIIWFQKLAGTGVRQVLPFLELPSLILGLGEVLPTNQRWLWGRTHPFQSGVHKSVKLGIALMCTKSSHWRIIHLVVPTLWATT